MIKEEFVLNV